MVRPVVISGPSGTGKSTLLKRLMAEYPNKFGFSVSNTTRKPREGEVNGVHYHFISVDQFRKAIDDREFVEWAEFSGNYYGTTFKGIEDVMKKGKTCLLDIDMQGVKAIKDSKLNAKFLFISPPSEEELKHRLLGRGTETDASISKRLEAAKREMEFSKTGVHDKIIVNDDIEKAYNEFRDFVTGDD